MKFKEFKQSVQGWQKDKGIYDHSTPLAQALKAVSEVGELADAVIKGDWDGIKDGNNRNFELENLEAVARADLMRRNTINRYPPELQGLAIQLGKMKKRITEVENDNNARH